MARKIIILETRRVPEGLMMVTGFYWFDIATVTARVPRPSYVSVGTQLQGTKAMTAPEQTALEDGSVREESFGITLAFSTTNAQIQAELVRRYNDRVAAIAAETPARQFFGASWDGAAWTA